MKSSELVPYHYGTCGRESEGHRNPMITSQATKSMGHGMEKPRPVLHEGYEHRLVG